MFEALIYEIKIHSDDALTPIFKLPIAGNDEGLALEGPAHDTHSTNPTVRTLPTMVDHTWQNANRICAAQGTMVMIKPIRTRLTRS